MSESQPAPQNMSIEELVNKQHLELVVEVRALAHAVSQLHTIFVKRKLLYWLLGAETALVILVMGFVGVFAYVENAHQNKLVNRLTDSCSVRNAQADSTKTFLNSEFAIQAESAQLTALYLSGLHFTTTPTEKALAEKVTRDQNNALHKWYTSQPADVQCDQLKGD